MANEKKPECEGCKRFRGYNWEGVAGCLCSSLINPEPCEFEPLEASE